MGTDRDDDLARTATAPLGSGRSTPGSPLEAAACATVGRYRLERELGAGGMGVVHAAFDPDLERRIALKVLRLAAPSVESKDRLMREARAMARLSHPNVVTVHEVGTANGRDFVAMELIHGGSLAEWLRAGRRKPAAIIDAFVAAGRGLAAAHAAGIVHRDFKPHNVLRGRDGRIVVTDFGLARQADGAVAAALDATLPVGAMTAGVTTAGVTAAGATTAGAASTPSSLAGITVTGALLGTPAYMAPEQWSGRAVTPATDQFAYCVALWEALTGERPYRGPTLDDLRTQVARGPTVLDASRVPRRIRTILRRGLDPDPARRWPSMDALLVQLVRAERRPGVAFALAGAAMAASVVVVALQFDGAAPPACQPPARDAQAVWSPAIAADMRAKTSDAHAQVLEATMRAWQASRIEACKAPLQVQQAQLQCLDGVLARVDALRQGYARVPGALPEDIQAEMIDPEICRKASAAEVPRLTLAATPEVIAAYELYGRSETDDKPTDEQVAALSRKPTADPCARVIATLTFEVVSKDFPRTRSLMNDAVGLVDQCGDERLRADLLIQFARYQFELPMIGPKGEAALRQAQAAARRVMQPDIEALVASRSVGVASMRGQWDDAFRLVDTAIAGYGARGLTIRQASMVATRNWLRLRRGEPGDLAAVASDVAAWRPLAQANRKRKLVETLEVQDALVRFRSGDVATAHPDLVRLWLAKARSDPGARRQRIEGVVVDTRGRPVAGATVMSAALLGADSIGIGVPMVDLDDTLRTATSDDAGRFVIEDAVPGGAIAAQLADRRSKAAVIADRVKLVLEPTRTVSGRVDLGGISPGRASVAGGPADDLTSHFHTMAPVLPDGSFVLAGVSVGAIRIGVGVQGPTGFPEDVELQTLPASTESITGLQLTMKRSNRVLDVIVRSSVSASLDGAEVILLSGKPPGPFRTVGDLMRYQGSGLQYHLPKPIIGEQIPKAVLGQVRDGDLIAHIEHARPGDLTVCALSFGGDLADPAVRRRIQERTNELTLHCEHIGPDTSFVVVTAPPQPRFD